MTMGDGFCGFVVVEFDVKAANHRIGELIWETKANQAKFHVCQLTISIYANYESLRLVVTVEQENWERRRKSAQISNVNAHVDFLIWN